MLAACWALAGCSAATPRGTTRESATVGECAPFEITLDDDSTQMICLLTEPQADLDARGASVATGALTDPMAMGTLPGSVDLRAQYMNGCVSVRNQAECGWCVVNAVSSALDAMYCEAGCPAPRASVNHLWSASHGGVIGDCGGGMHVADAMAAATSTRLAPETSWPYAGGSGAVNTTRPSASALTSMSQFQGMGVGTVARTAQRNMPDTAMADGIRRALASGRPVVVASEICQTMRSDWSGGRGPIDVDPTCTPGNEPACTTGSECASGTCNSGKCKTVRGHHAYVIVGYDQATMTFTALNSWGAQWGSGGYIQLSSAFVEQKIYGATYFQGVDQSRTRCMMPGDAGVGRDAGAGLPSGTPRQQAGCAMRTTCDECTTTSGCMMCDGQCVPASSISTCTQATRRVAECTLRAGDRCYAMGRTCEQCAAMPGCAFCRGTCLSWPTSSNICAGNRVAARADQCNDTRRDCEMQTSCGGCTGLTGCGWCGQRGSDLHATSNSSCVGGSATGSFRADCASERWTFGASATCPAGDAGVVARADTGPTQSGGDGGPGSTGGDSGPSTTGGTDGGTCSMHLAPCESETECCNREACINGRCGCAARGESCRGSSDCCGSSFCEGGACQ